MNLKIYTTLLFAIICTTEGYAQDPDRKHSIGIFQSFTDYNVELLDDKVFAFDSSLSQTTRIGYQCSWSPTWSFTAGLSNGYVHNQTLKENFTKKAFSLGFDMGVMFNLNNGRIIKQDALIGPYLLFGSRFDNVNSLKKFNESPWLVHNQYGVGSHINVSKRTALQIQVALDQKLVADFNTHLQYRIGVVQSIGRFNETKSLPSPNLDTDKDGVVDLRDNCLNVFGLERLKGCPDTLADESLANNNSDSLKDVIARQIQEISNLKGELEAITSSGSGEISSIREQELLRRLYYLRKDKDEKIELLEAQLKVNGVEPLKPAVVAKKSQPKSTVVIKQIPKVKPIKPAKIPSNALPNQPAISTSSLPADKYYYIITLSSPNRQTAQKWLYIISKDFPLAKILPQPNGYYRVGVYAGRDKAKAKAKLLKVREKNMNKAWLSVE